MIARLYIIVFAIFSCVSLKSQLPFDCNGLAYLSQVNDGEQTRFFSLNSGLLGFELNSLSASLPYNINAIGYNKTDNLIYGIDPERHELYRFGSDGVFESLQFLSLNGNYYAGDIGPNGSYLTLFNADSIATINLNSLESPISYTAVQTSDSINMLFVTDIAFHPLTGILYGFDGIQGKLVTIDPETGVVDNSSFPSIRYNSSIPAMYFDSRGKLFGIATDNVNQKSILFEFDVESGEASRVSSDGEVGDRDACSCPYTVSLFQELSDYSLLPCDELEVDITISNLSENDLVNISLEETFPQGFIIKEIVSMPFTGSIDEAIGSNRLSISEMEIPYGIGIVSLILEIPQDGIENYNFQASLQGELFAGFGTETLFSDDVRSAARNEHSTIFIENFSSLFTENWLEVLELCPEDSLRIAVPTREEQTYRWNDGSTLASRSFYTSGEFELVISNDCDSIALAVSIVESPLSVNLGSDLIVSYGGLEVLEAEINSPSPIVTYQWLNRTLEIPCQNCPSIQINPFEDTEYVLLVENEAGCRASDAIKIAISRDVYAPNIFSPDGNGINDYFYLHSSNPPLEINSMKIYNRWGVKVFEGAGNTTNLETAGWNGKVNRKKASPGVYFWTAELIYPDGKIELLTGEFTIMN